MNNPAPQKFPTVFQRIAPVPAARAILFWVALTVTIILTAWIIACFLLENTEFLPAKKIAFLNICTLLALGFTTVPLGIDIGYDVLWEWSRKVDNFARQDVEPVSEWFRAKFKVIGGDPAMLICGVTLGALSLVAFDSGHYFEGYPMLAASFLAAIMFVSSAIAGMGLYVVFWASRIFWEMGKLEKLSLKVQEHRFGVLSIGTALFKCWMIIGVIWAIYLATAYVGYTGSEPEKIINLPPMWLLAYPTLPFILGSFIVCQIPLHRKLVAHKQEEILRTDQMLDEIRPHNVEQITKDCMDKIEFLEKRKEQLRALPDWPFNKISLLGTGFSSFTAVLPVLVGEKFPGWLQPIIDSL